MGNLTKQQKAAITRKHNKENKLKEIAKDTGLTKKQINDTFLKEWSWEKMQHIFRKVWWDILAYARDNDLELRNIVAIMGKDTRKTTVWTIFLWFLMKEYPYLNGFLLRDTIDKATSQLKMQVRKSAELVNNEYGIKGFQDKVMEAGNDFYLVRDKNSKSNQKIELLSFDKIISLGGFTTNNGKSAVFIYDELQNPNSAGGNIINQKQFIANYKFIEKKNRGIEITTKEELVKKGLDIMPKWIPRHIFLSNRYVGSHPLNLFAEAHLPYYDHDVNGKLEKGVRSWMLEDPLNNNFIGKYFGKKDMQKGWEDLWGTMIIYGGPLCNELLRMDKEWEEEQMFLIERGLQEDLAYIIGDLFEGHDNSDKAYFYNRKDKITEDEFKANYAPYVEAVRIAVDVDYSRQIVMGAKYRAKKFKDAKDYGKIPIWRTIRDKFEKIKCYGEDETGRNTEMYIKQLYSKILEYCMRIHKLMPHIKKVKLIIDKNAIPARFNFGEYQNPFWIAHNAKFKLLWKIVDRPGEIDTMQDTGYVIDIEHPSIEELHQAYQFAKTVETTEKKDAQRMERANDPLIDIMNTDEYGLYDDKTFHAHNNFATKKLGGKNDW